MTDHFPALVQWAQKRKDTRGSLDVLYEKGPVVLKRSFSQKGVFRGMHLQRAPHQQTKLIRVVSGRIIDFVVVPDGKNVIHWRELDASHDWIKIAPEFAHGFYALEDSVFEYICDGAYNEEAEQSFSIINFLEKTMGFKEFTLSDKDRNATPLQVVLGSSTE